MLLETRRKRRRAGGAAFTVADLPRPPRQPPPAQAQAQAQTPTPPPPSARAVPRRLLSEQDEEKQEEGAMARRPSLALTTTPTPTAPPPRLVDRRVLLSRASRMQLLLMERLRCVDLRRARRAELLDEILRLRKIVVELQSDIDTTTRNLEQLEQLVLRLQQISFSGARAAAGGSEGTLLEAGSSNSGASGGELVLSLPPPMRLAPGTILWTNPEFSSNGRAVEQLSQAAKEDARKGRLNMSGASGCRFSSSNPP